MIIKNLWVGTIDDIKWRKKQKDSFYKNNSLLDTYIITIALVLTTPIIATIDLLLMPVEIGYYFFKKWINKN